VPLSLQQSRHRASKRSLGSLDGRLNRFPFGFLKGTSGMRMLVWLRGGFGGCRVLVSCCRGGIRRNDGLGKESSKRGVRRKHRVRIASQRVDTPQNARRPRQKSLPCGFSPTLPLGSAAMTPANPNRDNHRVVAHARHTTTGGRDCLALEASCGDALPRLAGSPAVGGAGWWLRLAGLSTRWERCGAVAPVGRRGPLRQGRRSFSPWFGRDSLPIITIYGHITLDSTPWFGRDSLPVWQWQALSRGLFRCLCGRKFRESEDRNRSQAWCSGCLPRAVCVEGVEGMVCDDSLVSTAWVSE